MDLNNDNITKDGDPTQIQGFEAPSKVEVVKPKFDGNIRKKRRRGKFKRKLIKPFVKVPWQDKRKNDKPKRNNRFRKIVLAKTQAPFNNNQFLMEIHKPEPENSFDILQTPARTRDSSFSIDSEDNNYFYSLPEDEEEYLTKEFSSVYEDAQSERLSNMSKNELIQEYLLLEAKYDNLIKRTEYSKQKNIDEANLADGESATDKDSMITDKDTSGTSFESGAVEPSYNDLLLRLKEQEEQLCELQQANEKLRLENEHLHQRPEGPSSEDSESDSSSSSDSDSSSSSSAVDLQIDECDNVPVNEVHVNGHNIDRPNVLELEPIVNGFHSPCEEN